MKTLATAVGTIVLAFLGFVALALLMAFPTKWLVNYLFSATFLLYIFGVAKITIWQALWLNVLTGLLFRSSVTKGSK